MPPCAKITVEDGGAIFVTISAGVVTIKQGGDILRMPLKAALELAEDLATSIEDYTRSAAR